MPSPSFRHEFAGAAHVTLVMDKVRAFWISTAFCSLACVSPTQEDEGSMAGQAESTSELGQVGGSAQSMGEPGSGGDTSNPQDPGVGGRDGSGGSDIEGGGSGGIGSETGGSSAGGSSAAGGGSGGAGEGDDRCSAYVNGDIPACCTPQGDNRDNVDEVVELLNTYRNSLGLNSLASDPSLEEAMHAHCIHMAEADFFSHTSPVDELSSPWDRAELCGARADAENIAAGQRSPASVMQAWQNSSGHDANMRGTHTLVGVGEYEYYWGQVFR